MLFVATSTALEASFAFGEDVEPFVIAATSVPLARSKLCCGPVIEKPWRCAGTWWPLKLADGRSLGGGGEPCQFPTPSNKHPAAGDEGEMDRGGGGTARFYFFFFFFFF